MKNSVKSLLLISFSLSAAVFLAACRSDRVSVDRKDPRSPQYAYRLDELAMLQMAVDDIQDLEQEKHYGKIYDDFASPAFKGHISRRRFLIWGNCAETYLGGLEEYDRNELGFFRQQVKKQASIDSIVRTVQRTKYVAKERMGFIYDGIHFKLLNWTWISNDKSFQQCMEESAQLEKSGQLVEEPVVKKDEVSKEKANPSSETHDSETRTERSDSQSNSNSASNEPFFRQKHSERDTSTEDRQLEGSGSNPPEKNSNEEETSRTKGDSVVSSPLPQNSEPSSLHYARAKPYRPTPRQRIIRTVERNEKPSGQAESGNDSPPVPEQH